jgi:tetratricopeptide (TPR) repeat protein
MMWTAIILIILSLLIIGIVVYRKIPQLRIIDTASIPQERERRVKDQLILERLNRTGGAKLRVVEKVATQGVRTVSKYGRRAVQRLYKMEQYYQKLKRTASEGQHAYEPDTVNTMIDEAERFEKQEEYIPAEKIYINIISHNPKSINAYEGLGNLYIKSGQYEQARETLKFTLRLAPEDASVNVSLAELEMAQGNHKTALEYLRKAIEKRSKNPKYLDLYIEASLESGSLKDARKGIIALKQVNAENKKLEDFERRFEEKKAAYVAKTTQSTGESSQNE